MSGAPRAPVPEWLRGLWRRRSIVHPDGRRDDTTRVYWLQTASAFADIRIPADRPDLRARGGLDALAPAELAALAHQSGFAGWTELDGDCCRWQREIDYQPFSGVPDEGRLRRGDDGVLIEEGIHERYVEVWEPVACGPGPTEVVARAAVVDGRRELLVASGDVFLFARDRRVTLPPAASLAALLQVTAGFDRAALLDCEISFGRRRGGAVAWEIQLSTLPHREGGVLAVDGAVSSTP